MAATDAGVAEIAPSCGLAGQSQFTTAFRGIAGTTSGAGDPTGVERGPLPAEERRERRSPRRRFNA